MRGRVAVAVRNYNNGKAKAGSAVRDLGCTVGKLAVYLESKFYDRDDGTTMGWHNRGQHGWHIDHIVPLNSFDLTNREQFLKACYYTNLQPLWEEDNIAKGAW